MNTDKDKENLRHLKRLSELFPTIGSTTTEIINLQSILNLPKGTEHFLSDLHGEYDAFSHVLRNGSGAVKKKIDEIFGHTLSNRAKRSLATLIYYPQAKMELVKKTEDDMENWYRITLYRLIEVCKTVSSKYSRSKVRKALPKDYAYVIEELITEKAEVLDKEAYYDEIVNTIIDIGCAEDFITALAELIQKLVIDRLHVLGDIYDRGTSPHFIMDCLCSYHSLDIQWGNHDIVWMGACAGQEACVATVVRNSLSYGNQDILEDGYGINLIPLASLAMTVYADDPCAAFPIKGEKRYSISEEALTRKMHKAIAIIQFKLEGQLAAEHPEYRMEHRRLLDQIDYGKGTICLNGREYALKDTGFPTIDPKNPYELSPEEKETMDRIVSAFRNSEKLRRHINLFLDKGGLYKVYNGNLLFHGCVPLNPDGSFREVNVYGRICSGRALYDELEKYVRKAFFAVNKEEKKRGRDIMWFIWAGADSPLYGKDRMTTFERYFLEEPEPKKERKNPYYQMQEDPAVVRRILEEFGLSWETGHIINGHVPVHQSEGENPVKCDGKLIVIDGGFCRAYQKVTGIAGYTLVCNSYGMQLSAHHPFVSVETAVREERDIVSTKVVVSQNARRHLIGDTDTGHEIVERIEELKQLLEAYREGVIKEKK